ncbi:MAG: 6-phosphofructokinase, partial [Dehalococcoidia bacterium]
MARQPKDNALVLQSGGPTPVMNRSLTGIVQEALRQDAFDTIYGAVHGMDGLLGQHFIDLGRQPKRLWPAIARTPGAALGSARRKLEPGQIEEALDVLERAGVRCLLSIGGNDSAENAHLLARAAAETGRPLTVIAVPKTVDNDLPETDHCPGYGSAARFIAVATMGAGREAEALRHTVPVTVLEVMGRNAGWLSVAAALGKRDQRGAPQFVVSPETPVVEDWLVSMAVEALRGWGFA